MPDITMCTNENCSIKHKCYRHEAIPSEYNQSYMKFQFNEEDNTCSSFKEINGRLTAHEFYLK